MFEKRQFERQLVALAIAALVFALAGGCHSGMKTEGTPGPKRDINAVLHDHDRELMAMPGVVGVYVGLLDDERTECLKVMLARKDRNLERAIPRMIEGYHVVTEVTGEIKPLAPEHEAGRRGASAAPE